jgi:MOSC domain-containing protein YiiM
MTVELPPGPSQTLLVRSLAACLASVTEVPLTDLPARDVHHVAEAVRSWRSWLAGHGFGLVAVADPERFAWPGYWVAVLGQQDSVEIAVLMFGTPPGVVLSPGNPDLLGRAAADLPVRKGFVVAPLEPRLAAALPRPRRLRGRVEAIAIAPHATGPMRLLNSAEARAGHGLAGDRYASHAGTFTPSGTGRGYDLTLIEAETLDELVLEPGNRLGYAEARRNLVTRGIGLNALVGRRFRVGDVECLGQRLCEPCAHLERLTHRGVLRGLIHRGGLRADILTNGTIATGAVIETTDHG